MPRPLLETYADTATNEKVLRLLLAAIITDTNNRDSLQKNLEEQLREQEGIGAKKVQEVSQFLAGKTHTFVFTNSMLNAFVTIFTNAGAEDIQITDFATPTVLQYQLQGKIKDIGERLKRVNTLFPPVERKVEKPKKYFDNPTIKEAQVVLAVERMFRQGDIPTNAPTFSQHLLGHIAQIKTMRLSNERESLAQHQPPDRLETPPPPVSSPPPNEPYLTFREVETTLGQIHSLGSEVYQTIMEQLRLKVDERQSPPLP